MWKLLGKVTKWLLSHIEIRSRNLNEGDPDAKPKPSVEAGIRVSF